MPESPVQEIFPRPAAATAAQVEAPALRSRLSVIKDYWALTKPEITFLVAVSAFMGYLLGSPGEVYVPTLIWTLLGVILTSGGVGVLNHYIEWEFDAQMKRTAARPIPSGRVRPQHAMIFGIVLVAAGLGVLCPMTNPLTGVLGALSAAMYLFVYTPLKRTTTLNTLIGTIPGALPALGGWTAATNNLEPGGWVVFAILAFWQMPHFFSLAWMYRKDYGRARYAMLPVLEPDGRSTSLQTLVFTLLLAGVSVLPYFMGLAGLVYLAGAVVSAAMFILPALAFYRTRSTPDAKRVLMASIRYIPLLLVFQIVDRFV